METRRQRERQERRRLIVDTARRIAQTEGWEAVTTRRLANDIEYSQPVLYSHFTSKTAIMAAVAADGVTELVHAIDEAAHAIEPADRIDAVARAYLRYAATHRAVYEAIFTPGIDSGDAHTARIRDALDAAATERDGAALALWPLLHGIASLAGDRHIDYTDTDHARAVASLLSGERARTARLIVGGKLTRAKAKTPAQ
ncbi:hypothetical protein STSO111631_12105 [Stackebrandtia soli]